jgi:hypothetical protein
MARASTPPPVIVAPSNNVYTALALAALIGVALSLAVLFLRGMTLSINWLH